MSPLLAPYTKFKPLLFIPNTLSGSAMTYHLTTHSGLAFISRNSLQLNYLSPGTAAEKFSPTCHFIPIP